MLYVVSCPEREVIFISDLFSGEGYADLSKPGDNIYPLVIIDKFLFSTQSQYANIWRNLVKLVLLPVQAIRLRRILEKYPPLHCARTSDVLHGALLSGES